MKIQISTALTRSVMDTALRVIPKRTAQPILENVLIRAGQNEISFITTDTESVILTVVQVSAEPHASVSEPGDCLIPAQLLRDMLTHIEDDTVALETTGENTATLKYAAGNGSMPAYKAEDFPWDIPEIEGGQTLEFPAKALADVISGTGYACVDDTLRPVFGAILFRFGPDGTRFAASDARCLVENTIRSVTAEATTEELVKLNDGIRLARIISGYKDNAEAVKLTYDPSGQNGKIVFSVGDSRVSVTTVKGRFPDYLKLFPENVPNVMTADRETLLSTIKRISVCAGSVNRYIKMSVKPNITGADLLVEASDMGFKLSAKETVPVDYTGESITIGFNAESITEVLKHIDSDRIRISFISSKKPALFEPEEQKEDGNVRAVLVPVMVQ